MDDDDSSDEFVSCPGEKEVDSRKVTDDENLNQIAENSINGRCIIISYIMYRES